MTSDVYDSFVRFDLIAISLFYIDAIKKIMKVFRYSSDSLMQIAQASIFFWTWIKKVFYVILVYDTVLLKQMLQPTDEPTNNSRCLCC